ncbi:MAG: helix-turn-helix domain-containing protein [Actinomycetota bacterium]|nr:helix-turn-helix domain-containing protein [Actinomycetota bacterium]
MTNITDHPDRSVPDPDTKPTLTVQEVARILGIARASAFRAIEAGEIPSIRVGRRILVPTAALRTLLQLAA